MNSDNISKQIQISQIQAVIPEIRRQQEAVPIGIHQRIRNNIPYRAILELLNPQKMTREEIMNLIVVNGYVKPAPKTLELELRAAGYRASYYGKPSATLGVRTYSVSRS